MAVDRVETMLARPLGRSGADRSARRWRLAALATTALVGLAGGARADDAPSAPSVQLDTGNVPPAYLGGSVAPPAGHARPVLRRLTLTLSGVAGHEWQARPGSRTVVMPVRLDDVDDVLRSVTATGGSHLLSVGLPGPDDASAAFDALPFQPDDLANPLALLNALRGNSVSIRNAGAADSPVVGVLLSAERRSEPVPGSKSVIERTRITIKTADGIAQTVLEDLGALTFVDPTLNARIATALAVLRRRTNAEIREVQIDASPGPDGVTRFTTVTKAPLWKTAYRLVLPPGARGTAQLTAIAVIENTDASDWDGVDLTLQSGNPVSFRQAIYRRADVDRPEAAVDQQEHRLPTVDQRGIATRSMAPPLSAPAPAIGMAMKAAPGAAMEAPAAPSMQSSDAGAAQAEPAEAAPPPEPATGVGQSFHLQAPVNLAAGRSAALPFIEASIPFERIDRLGFRQANPMQAVRVTNDTGASWPGGAVSTQDADGFTGDALIPALPSGQSRMLDFASDLAVDAHWDAAAVARRLTGYKVANGVATITLSLRSTTTIDVTGSALPLAPKVGAAPSPDPTTVVIELPRQEGTTATVRGATMDDPTTSSWRARATLAAGASAQVRFDVDRTQMQSLRLIDATGVLVGLEGQDLDGLSAGTREALHRLVALQGVKVRADAAVAMIQSERGEAAAEQQRTRQNVQALSGADPQRGRYVELLGQQEAVIASLTAQLAKSRAAALEAATQLSSAAASLTIE